MSTAIYPRLQLLACLTFALAACAFGSDCCLADDFDVLGKDRASVTSSDFKSSLLGRALRVGQGNATAAQPLFVGQFPALNKLGISGAKIVYAPLGGNPPNVHPRGSEFFHVLEGNLYVAFLDSSNRLYANNLTAGDTTIIPRGLLHVVFNFSRTKKAVALAAFSSENPGIYLVPQALFRSTGGSIPDPVLATNFGVPLDIIKDLRLSVPTVPQAGGPAQGF